MKKFLSIMTCLFLCFSMTACGKEGGGPQEPTVSELVTDTPAPEEKLDKHEPMQDTAFKISVLNQTPLR